MYARPNEIYNFEKRPKRYAFVQSRAIDYLLPLDGKTNAFTMYVYRFVLRFTKC